MKNIKTKTLPQSGAIANIEKYGSSNNKNNLNVFSFISSNKKIAKKKIINNRNQYSKEFIKSKFFLMSASVLFAGLYLTQCGAPQQFFSLSKISVFKLFIEVHSFSKFCAKLNFVKSKTFSGIKINNIIFWKFLIFTESLFVKI